MKMKSVEIEFLNLEDSKAQLCHIAQTYLESAQKVKSRIAYIKEQIKLNEIIEDPNENRIIILEAEYYYLVRTAKFLESYYSTSSV